MLLGPVQKTAQSANAELLLNAPVGEVFGYLTNLRNMVVWWQQHTSYRLLFGNMGPGSIYTWTYRDPPWPPIAGMSMVQTRNPDALFVYYVATAGIRLRFEYHFAPAEGGTHVSFAMKSLLLPPPISGPELTGAFEQLSGLFEPAPAGCATRCNIT